MKTARLFALVLALCAVLSVSCSDKKTEAYPTPDRYIEMKDEGRVSYTFTAHENGYFYRRGESDRGELFYVKGVNIGLTEPLTDLSEADVSRETFAKWFEMIGAMNANAVRAFTVMNPGFYAALADYNEAHPGSELYLFQGIWFPEDLLYDPGDALDEGEIVRSSFKKAITETVDAVHGSSNYTAYGSLYPAIYSADVSKYVCGYILGLEYPSEFVTETNKKHTDEASFTGEYLQTTEAASPFEAFLCDVGDELIKYESSRYLNQTPVSFLSWQPLDVITHSAEPFKDECDSVSVDPDHVAARENYAAGLFAAMDVYPYYPEYMSLQREYVDYVDPEGTNDNYRAYLNDICEATKLPLLIAEYGLSTSRGVAHQGVCGYAQGGLSETEAAPLLARMTRDVAKSGCAGGLIFEWSDEWFKSTWNEVSYEPAEAALRSHDLGSAEQGFGLICHEDAAAIPDGNDSEWITSTGLEHTRICVKYDAEYMHLLISFPEGFDFENGTYYVPISVTGEGSRKMGDLSFDRETDYVLVIHGKDDTRLLCDAYRDVFDFRQTYLRAIYGKDAAVAPKKDTGDYHPIRMLTANSMDIFEDGTIRDPQTVETGKLRYGNADPSSPDFDSLADFCLAGEKLEVRIAWYLLGVVNARTRTCIGPLRGDKITFSEFENIYIGAGESGRIALSDANFTDLAEPSLTLRAKKTYDELGAVFAEITLTDE